MANCQFDNCAVTISRINRDKDTTKAVWLLEGLEDASSRYLLLSEAKLNMEVGSRETGYQFQLEFFLNQDGCKNDQGKYCRYVQIMARMVRSNFKDRVPFDFEIRSVLDSSPAFPLTKKCVYLKLGSGEHIVNNLIMLLTHQDEDVSGRISKSYSVGIAVTPIFCNTTRLPEPLAESPMPLASGGNSLETLSKHLEHLYMEEQSNYVDLKVESKDGVVLNAHKIILAARCPRFRDQIKKAEKQDRFNGTLIISDVNGKPLMALLHWMYTGKLQNDAESFMEELIAAAVKYELTELVAVLDKQLIKICNEDNMLQLFQTAKQNGMTTAVRQISAFIRENI